jgi:hypothetical protein
MISISDDDDDDKEKEGRKRKGESQRDESDMVTAFTFRTKEWSNQEIKDERCRQTLVAQPTNTYRWGEKISRNDLPDTVIRADTKEQIKSAWGLRFNLLIKNRSKQNKQLVVLRAPDPKGRTRTREKPKRRRKKEKKKATEDNDEKRRRCGL